ncbi:hypothetical protein [Mycobacteroides chelonae]|nr:hypothetical protein [Mycobacteroides chelonae]
MTINLANVCFDAITAGAMAALYLTIVRSCSRFERTHPGYLERKDAAR